MAYVYYVLKEKKHTYVYVHVYNLLKCKINHEKRHKKLIDEQTFKSFCK